MKFLQSQRKLIDTALTPVSSNQYDKKIAQGAARDKLIAEAAILFSVGLLGLGAVYFWRSQQYAQQRFSELQEEIRTLKESHQQENNLQLFGGFQKLNSSSEEFQEKEAPKSEKDFSSEELAPELEQEESSSKELVDIINLQKDMIAAEDSIQTSLVQRVSGFFQAIAGLFVGVTVYTSLQTLKATQDNVKISQQNLRATEEKQVAERFNKAVELLSHDKEHVHLGGVYALEKIADAEEYYYFQIMELLTAYLREKAPYPPIKDQDSLPLANVEAVMLVLGRSQRKRKERQKSQPNLKLFYPNLSRIDLQGVKLGSNDDLSNADLAGSNLQGADLSQVVLQDAVLQGANLRNASLIDANLSGANLQGADLTKADFYGTELCDADLRNSDLTDAQNLQEAQLKDTWAEGVFCRIASD